MSTRYSFVTSAVLAAAAGLAVCLGSTARYQDGGSSMATPEGGAHDDPAAPIEQLAADNTAFAFDLYGMLRETPGNLFISPYSVSSALAMTYAGARADTAEQMAHTLHFTLENDLLHRTFAQLDAGLNASGTEDGSHVLLNTANRLWGRVGSTYQPSFLSVTSDSYGAELQPIDFAGNLDLARATINDWVSVQTSGMIKDLLKPTDLSTGTELVLTNAVYFKGDWAIQFDEAKTIDAPFWLSRERIIRVPIMHLRDSFAYYESSLVKMVELPYDGNRLSMVIIIPALRHALTGIDKALRADALMGWINDMKVTEVDVALPRFTMSDRHSLVEPLERMGMPLAFAPGKADFSGICGTPGSLWIDMVIHQAAIEVNEVGTEAAAATAVGITKGSIGGPSLYANEPFLFLIRDRETNTILFLGRCVDPR